MGGWFCVGNLEYLLRGFLNKLEYKRQDMVGRGWSATKYIT